MFPQSNDLKPMDERWHRKAQEAKETTSGLDEWSESEITRWDLDEDGRRPTGRENPRTYQYDKPLADVTESGAERRDRVDVRDRHDR